MRWLPPRPTRSPKPLPPPSERLDSWKEIAEYLRRDVRTAKRWEHTKGLPVHRLSGGAKSTIYAFRPELDAWWHSRGVHVAQEESAPPAPTPAARRKLLRAAGAAGLLIVTAVALYRFLAYRHPPPPPKLTPLTSYSGGVFYPSFSPDGKEVVYTRSEPTPANWGLYVKRIGPGEPQRLTRDAAGEFGPVWSPDGHFIAFARWRPGASNAQVLVVPARGGAERVLCEGPAVGVEPIPVMSWTPDSRRVIVSCDRPPNPPGLCFCPAEPAERRPGTAPSESPGYHSPAISPDGTKLALIRASNVFLVDLGPDFTPRGQPRQLTHEPCCVSNPLWTGDGREILYVKHGEYIPVLLRIPADGSAPPKPVTSLGCWAGTWRSRDRATNWSMSAPRRIATSGAWRCRHADGAATGFFRPSGTSLPAARTPRPRSRPTEPGWRSIPAGRATWKSGWPARTGRTPSG